MKTLVLVAFGVAALALLASAQRPGAAAKAASKPDPQALQALGYAAPSTQQGAAPGGAPKSQEKPGGPVGGDPKLRARNVATMIVNIERAHRDRVARLERLRQLYEKSGAAEQLEKVARLRAVEHARYEAAMRGYEKDLGPALFAQVRSALELNAGQPPGPTPAAVPPPGIDPGEPAQKPRGERQKGRR